MEELNKGYEFTRAQIAELESLRAWKAEIEKQEPARPDWYQNPTSEQWFECPDDAQILEDIGPVKVGDVIELDVCWNGKQKFRVAKISDEQSDDVEFDLVEGTKLFAAQVVSPDVDALKAKPAENYFELACHEYRQKIQSLQVDLEAARKDAEWISVDDRLPERYTGVMVWPHPSEQVMTAEFGLTHKESAPEWHYSEYISGFGWEEQICNPTHWKPLPAPPAIDQANGARE